MYTTNLTRPAYRRRFPVTLRCTACDATMAAYDVADTGTGTMEYETADGDPVDKCWECGSPELAEEIDLPDYDPHNTREAE